MSSGCTLLVMQSLEARAWALLAAVCWLVLQMADLMRGLGFRGAAAAAMASRCPDAWQWKQLLITHCMCVASSNGIVHSTWAAHCKCSDVRVLQTAGAPAATTHPVAEAGTMMHQPLRHIAVRQFCLTEGSGYTGKRRRENSDEGDDEAGPSTRPRTGV